jgi:hypothetical protein
MVTKKFWLVIVFPHVWELGVWSSGILTSSRGNEGRVNDI